MVAVIALVQCYVTRTQNGCAPLSYLTTMAECRTLAADYRRPDIKALNASELPAVVNYRCVATDMKRLRPPPIATRDGDGGSGEGGVPPQFIPKRQDLVSNTLIQSIENLL